MYFSIDLSRTSRVRKIRESDNLSYVFEWRVCIFSEEHAIVCWGNNKIRRNKKHWDYICIRSKINFVLHFFPSIFFSVDCNTLWSFIVLRPFTNFTVLLNARDIGMFFFFSVFLLLFSQYFVVKSLCVPYTWPDLSK